MPRRVRLSVDQDHRRLSLSALGFGDRLPLRQLARRLRRLWDDKGFVNYKLINACDYLPHADSIASRFNGLTKAYEQAGLPYRLQDICRAAKLRNGLAAAGIVDKPPRRPNVTRNADGSPFTDEQLAEILRRLAAEHGYLTERLIMLTPGVPKASFFRTRFGSLEQAYAAAGWAASRSDFMRSAIARSRGGALKPYEPWEDEVADGDRQAEPAAQVTRGNTPRA